MLSYGRVRSAFAYAFPLLLGSLYILAGHYVYQNYLARQSEANRNQLLSRATILAARVKSEYTITQQAEKAFRLILEKAIEISAMRPFSVDLEFSDLVRSNMPPQLLNKCRIWAFSNQNGNFVLANSHALMQTKKRAMERAFTELVNLADHHSDTSSRRTGEKFITGLFGENSAPEYLASHRLGQMTPVQFEGSPHYVYWQRFSRLEDCTGGFIALFPGDFVEDIRSSTRGLATRLAKESGDDLFISFPGSPLVDHRFAPVFAEQHQQKPGQFKSVMRSLQKLIYSKKQLPMRQLYETGDWWHYLDLVSQETHYYIAISGKKPVESQKHIALPGLAIFAATWSAIFFLRLRHSRFTLGLAFKMLFFMTGMLPVLAFSFLGFNLIDQSHEVAIQQEVSQAYSRIEQIDEKSAECVALTGMIIKELLEDRNIHHGLVDAMPGQRQEAFNSLKNRLQKRGFYLNYLLLIRGGEPSEYYVSAPVHLPYAKYHLEYYTISASALNDVLIKQTRLPAIPLTTSQKSMLGSLGGADNPSAKDVFLSSLDRINSFQAGSAASAFFSTILGNKDQIGCYLVLGLSVAETVLEMLKNQLNLLNSDPRNLFFCFSRDFSTGLKIFPANHRFIKSAHGQQFRQFLESAASSLFRIEIRRPDEVFIYEPLAKVKHYFGGAVIDLHETNRQRELKLILLTLMAALLAGTIYLLASAVSSLMIQPAHKLTVVFKEVASGNYSQEFSYPFNNELGQLATATSQMVKGLKERRLLGKFVSTTFDTGVKLSHQQASGQEIAGTVLFSDIRSFTTLSESYPPEEIGNLLNTHLREMVEIIHNCSGRVEQFIGDAIVAFFPGDSNVSCPRALHAATTMMQQHIAIQGNRRSSKKPTYEIGIGLDFGTVMAGILHSGNRSEFTVIGPARSCAEQCEAASKTGRFTRIIATRKFAMATPEFNNRFSSHNADLFELENLETRS